MDDLDPEQQAAVSSTASRLAVIAGAGTGKTRVLTHRAARLCRERLPHRVLCVTFTRKAAREMRERLETMGGYMPEVRTFHAWCGAFIREHAEHIGRSPKFVVYDEVDALEVLRMCARECGVKNWEKARGETLVKDPTTVDLYKRRLREADALDYEALEVFALDILKQGLGVDRYDDVLIDEAQDLSAQQWTILAYLHPHNVAMIGDTKQTIYSWRGARLDLFDDFARRDDVETIVLRRNYRSRAPIVHTANQVLTTWEPMESHRPLTDREIEQAGVGAIHVEAHVDRNQPQWVAASIERAVQQGRDPSSIAVLGRSWREVAKVRDQLDRRKVPTAFYGESDNLWTHPWARMLARALMMVGRGGSDDNLAAMVMQWGRERFGPQEMQEMRSTALRERSTLLEVAGRTSGAMRQLRIELAEDPEMVDAGDVASRICLATLGRVPVELRPLIDQQKGATVASWQDWWTFGRREMEQPIGEGVQLMTIHAAKGLEWPVVYGLSVMEGVFPGQHDADEDKRLLYVLITRARDRLVLCRSAAFRGQEAKWSPFLREALQSIREAR